LKGSQLGRRFNLGGHQAISLADAAGMIAKLAGPGAATTN